MARQIKEMECTCRSCGHVYYYGKSEEWANVASAAQNAGKSLSCCTGCLPALLIKDKPVRDLDRCPNCGSKNVAKRVVVHTV